MQACTSTSVQSTKQGANIKVYPNPTNGLVQIELLESSGSVATTIYSIDGRQLLSKRLTMDGQATTLDFSGLALPNGIYLLQIVSGEASSLVKLFVQRQ